MDIHCPKHDAHEAGGGPELPCAPCPWCSAPADAKDEWGYLITHKSKCYWTNIHGDPIGRVRVNFSEVAQWNTRVSEPSDVISREAAVRAVSTFCDQFETLGDRFKKQLRNIVRALPAIQPLPTPADEEVARENLDRCICAEPQPCEASVPMHYQDLLRLVLGRTLAEACRAGTPTTDARAASVVDHLFTILARDYNIELTNNDASELTETVASALSSTPSVAQRARAAAGEIAKGMGSFFVDGYTEIIIKHFATDVEQGTCTWPLGIDAEWYTECGFALDTVRRTKAMKFCAFCGKSLVEATKESEASNVR